MFFFSLLNEKKKRRLTGKRDTGGKGRAGFNNKEVLKRVIQVLQHVGVYISLLGLPGRLVTHRVCFEFLSFDLAILFQLLCRSGTQEQQKNTGLPGECNWMSGDLKVRLVHRASLVNTIQHA